MNDKYITVTQLTRYIKYKIDNDVNLNEVFLKGEISNFKMKVVELMLSCLHQAPKK